MNRLQRHGGAVLLVIGVSACQPPEPPVLAPSAAATRQPARQAAANDDGPAVSGTVGTDDEAPASVALDHAGDVLVGQRLADLEELGPWQSRGSIEAGPRTCSFLAGTALPEGVLMRVDDDHVVRFDLGHGPEPDALLGQPGPFGIRLGMPREAAVGRLPGNAPALMLSPPSEAADEYLLWQDPDTDLALGIEVYEERVVRLYWGISEAVELIEGCSE